LFFVFAFFPSSPLSPFLSFRSTIRRILVVGSSLRWRSLEATSFYNNLCVEPSSNPKKFGAFHLVSATCGLVLVYPRLQDISKLLTDKVRFSNYRNNNSQKQTYFQTLRYYLPS
jgi:hypothetical protein